MSVAVECHPDCTEEGSHAEDCAWLAHEMKYWARHYGQDYGTKAARLARLESMDPRNERAKAEGGGK